MALPSTGPVNQVSISENISEGQRVRVYKVEGFVPGEGWKILCSGTSVGHKRIQMFEPAVVSKVRFTATKTAAMPVIREFAVWNVSGRIVKT
jgi:hypothetical protein